MDIGGADYYSPNVCRMRARVDQEHTGVSN